MVTVQMARVSSLPVRPSPQLPWPLLRWGFNWGHTHFPQSKRFTKIEVIKQKVIYCMWSGVRPGARPGRKNIPAAGIRRGGPGVPSQGHHVPLGASSLPILLRRLRPENNGTRGLPALVFACKEWRTGIHARRYRSDQHA